MKPRVRPGRSIKLQRGQALVLGLLVVGLMAVVLVRYFTVGQVVAAKAKQLHALDAAAYSGALVQARALNMLAYINRGQVGHQVAMAHLVTLGSWAAWGGAQARQAGMGNPPAYLIAMLFGPEHGAAYQAARGAAGIDTLAQIAGRLAQAYAAHDNVVRGVFSDVQNNIVLTLPDARWAAMQEVLARNYSQGSGSPRRVSGAITEGVRFSGASMPDSKTPPAFKLILLEDNWAGYLQRYPGRQLKPFVQAVAQTYEFLSPRDHSASSLWAVDARCPAQRHELRRRGSTEIDARGVWQSVDTQSFHALRSNRWIGCYYREYPMGWGWIPAAMNQVLDGPYVDNAPDNFSAQDFWRWVAQSTNWDIVSGDANPLANSKAAAARQRWPGGGLSMYFDTNPQSEASRLRFALELRHPGPEGLIITTRSAAESFFERPEPRPDRRPEQANLFHPYWQARLAPLEAAANRSGGTP